MLLTFMEQVVTEVDDFHNILTPDTLHEHRTPFPVVKIQMFLIKRVIHFITENASAVDVPVVDGRRLRVCVFGFVVEVEVVFGFVVEGVKSILVLVAVGQRGRGNNFSCESDGIG